MGLVRISDRAQNKVSELKGELGIGEFIEMLIDDYESNADMLGISPATKEQAEEIIAILKGMSEKNIALAAPKGLRPVRTKFLILNDINNLKAKRSDELELCQDAEFADGIYAKYAPELQSLQDEYDSLV